VLGRAPNFTDTQEWFNTPGDRPLSLSKLRGHVVLVDFWTYSCINCIRTLPYLNAWYQRYHREGLEIVGVHTPEFPFERSAGNVEAAISQDGIRYPVVQDNDYGTWNAYGNQYWPAEYLIDAEGRVRSVEFGEGDYAARQRAIRSLLAEAGSRHLGHDARPHAQRPSRGLATPESYLGSARADRFADGPINPGPRDFGPAPRPGPNELSYGGTWTISPEAATAGPDASLELNFRARRVFVVLGPTSGAADVRVLLDGQPISQAVAGADVHDAVLRVSSDRLYRIVDLPRVENHVLTLEPRTGVRGYSFTFG
jgi:thiol-disulfide isomerase/thioredoxin